jgi:NAD(P)-dependent dehydrogenase (short-subunit alcohol dehydrogenase family)
LSVVKETKKVYGSLDILVNNAGQFWIKPLADTSLEDFSEICSVNINGTWLGMKHGLSEMNDGGAIINVSSLMGQMGLPEGTGYCASKGAVTSMTKAVALETAKRKIRVNALHPGVIWTPMVGGGEDGDEGLKNFFIQETPIRMVGLPEHVADAILFLCTAEYVTGIELNVDGGRLADGAMGSHAG